VEKIDLAKGFKCYWQTRDAKGDGKDGKASTRGRFATVRD
jgi:hypothetical protein